MSTISRKSSLATLDAQRTRGTPATALNAGPIALTPDRTRARAYEIYLARSRTGAPGDCVSDWLRAESELNGLADDSSGSSSRVKDLPEAESLEAKALMRGDVLLHAEE